MIEINLVPLQLRKNEHSSPGTLILIGLPKEIVFGVAGGVVTVLILAHSILFGLWAIKSVQYVMYQAAWQKMSPDKKNIDAISKEQKDLKTRMATITDVTSKKAILWSQKLNIISDALPKGVWLNKMTWDNNVLTMQGGVVSKTHGEMALASNFVSNLKGNEDFVKDFSSIELNSVTQGKKGVTEVADFTITAKIK